MAKPWTSVFPPKCPINSAAYERLYEFNQSTDRAFELDGAWNAARINPNLTDEAVYRMLPIAADFEYGGYLTKSRIRYCECGPDRADVPSAKPVTFHSHPASHENADVPSPNDVFYFLQYRHLRTITVGARFIWVWDKTKATLETVGRLRMWADANMLPEMRRLQAKHPQTFAGKYLELALKRLGLVWPSKPSKSAKDWAAMLRTVLKFKVTVLSR